MNTEELYGALSARVTAAVIEQETDDWPKYFEGLRAVIRRVVVETPESGLSEEEKQALIQRLEDHVSSLEEWWVKLKAK
jgi:hypothetical protein